MITAVEVYQSSKSYILNRFRQVHSFGVRRPAGALWISRAKTCPP